MVIVVLICQSLSRTSPFSIALSDLGQREPNIDGLRGFCALLVAAHHLVFYARFVQTNEWSMPDPADHMLLIMGKSAVAYFFLICAYLFWGKLSARLRAGSSVDFTELMRNRLLRLIPLYIFAMTAAILVIGLWGEDFVIHQNAFKIAKELVQSYAFSFLGDPWFNGLFLAYAAIGVSWSLKYEWMFYVSLPVLSVLRLPRWWWVALPGLIILNERVLRFNHVDYFAYGAIAYELSRIPRVRRLCSSWLADVASLSLFLAVNYRLSVTSIGLEYGPLALALSFLPIASGARWFGLLRLNGLRLIGCVSYSLYLLNIVIYFPIRGALDVSSPFAAIAAETTLLTIAVGLCFGTYMLIERPFMPKRSVVTADIIASQHGTA